MELPHHGTTRWYSKIVRAVFDAATDPTQASTGVLAQRAGGLERVRFALADLAHAQAEVNVAEARMLSVLDELGLTALATSIPGISAVGAATILAEAGDPARFSSARALVKHAGLCPRDNASGTYQGKTTISGRGRPELRLAAWRAVFAALQHNPVLAARHAHLTGRPEHRLTDAQARVAVAASLLRQLAADGGGEAGPPPPPDHRQVAGGADPVQDHGDSGHPALGLQRVLSPRPAPPGRRTRARHGPAGARLRHR